MTAPVKEAARRCKCGRALYASSVTGMCRPCYDEHRRFTPSKPPAKRDPDSSRRRYLPDQLRAARRKVEMLEREAARLGIEV